MNPKKAKKFEEDIAKEVEVHPQVVEDFIKFYYDLLRKHLSNLTYPKIFVQGLGTFVIRRKKLNSSIQKQKDILGNITKQTYKGYEKMVAVKDKLEKLNNMQAMHDEMLNDKKAWKEKKKKNEK